MIDRNVNLRLISGKWGFASVDLEAQATPQEQLSTPNSAPPVARSDRFLGRLRSFDRWLLALIILFALTLPAVDTHIYASDEIEYFSYLHSVYFDHDFDFTNEYTHIYLSNPVKFKQFKIDFLDTHHEPLTGRPQNVGPIGSALFWTPYYGIAHIYTLVRHALGGKDLPDGYSQPYISAAAYGSAINGFIGLILIYLICRDLFARPVSFLATVTIWLATPVLFYTHLSPLFSHADSLLAAALFFFVWWKTLGKRAWWGWLLLGVCAGLMADVREQDGLLAFVPALESLWYYFVFLSPASLRENNRLPGRLRAYLASIPQRGWTPVRSLFLYNVLFLIALFITFTPQLLAYKGINGWFGPSTTVSQKLHPDSPYALLVLFDGSHGAFIWAPVLMLSVVGLYFLWRRQPWLGVMGIIAFLAEIYICGAFQTWSQAGSFGSRRLVVLTVIFTLGLAALFDWLRARRLPWFVLIALCGGFIAWNGGLLMNWAFWSTNQRQGLDWTTLPQDQLARYKDLPTILWNYMFNRSSLYDKKKP